MNNKTLKLTGLSEEEVQSLIEHIYERIDNESQDYYNFKCQEIGKILLGKEVIVHFDTINNKDHIIRF